VVCQGSARELVAAWALEAVPGPAPGACPGSAREPEAALSEGWGPASASSDLALALVLAPG
jgi:hypothetical protein